MKLKNLKHNIYLYCRHHWREIKSVWCRWFGHNLKQNHVGTLVCVRCRGPWRVDE